MLNFEFQVPTKIIFGRDTHKNVGRIIRDYGYNKILLHYGGGSIKNNGLYNEVVMSLRGAGVEFIELGGVEPNPKLSLALNGAELCRNENVQLVLAVGGGSVMDSAKMIAVASKNEGDPWDFSLKKRTPTAALPVGTILTLSASGSEMSASAVITNEDGKLKRGYNSPFHRPLFSICNPELTYTVNKFQTGCGIVDIMMHTLERYFSDCPDTDLTDRIAEGLLRSTADAGRIAIADPRNYDARATLMWASSLSHCDLTGVGRDVFMAVHQMEHELSGMYDHVAHGAGLSVLFPAWAKYVYAHQPRRFAQYAVRVWDCTMDETHPEKTALKGITCLENYFEEIGMPTRLSHLGVGGEGIEEMSEKCTFHGGRVLPGYVPLDTAGVKAVFELAK